MRPSRGILQDEQTGEWIVRGRAEILTVLGYSPLSRHVWSEIMGQHGLVVVHRGRQRVPQVSLADLVAWAKRYTKATHKKLGRGALLWSFERQRRGGCSRYKPDT